MPNGSSRLPGIVIRMQSPNIYKSLFTPRVKHTADILDQSERRLLLRLVAIRPLRASRRHSRQRAAIQLQRFSHEHAPTASRLSSAPTMRRCCCESDHVPFVSQLRSRCTCILKRPNQELSSDSMHKSNMSSASPAVETFSLVKQFGDFVAVDHIDLRVNRGSFFGFLGPNGAGKSTTIKMLTGLLAPTSGTLRVLDLDIAQQPMEVKRRIGVVPEDSISLSDSPARRCLSFTGRMYGLRSEDIAQRSKELLELMELQDEPKKADHRILPRHEEETLARLRADSSSRNTLSRRAVRRRRRDRFAHVERSACRD